MAQCFIDRKRVKWFYGVREPWVSTGEEGGGTEDDKEGPQWWQDMSGPVMY